MKNEKVFDVSLFEQEEVEILGDLYGSESQELDFAFEASSFEDLDPEDYIARAYFSAIESDENPFRALQ